ncbi:MAG: arginine--tRNA ligase, partial [Candidatus Micrarchaeota archaeon]
MDSIIAARSDEMGEYKVEIAKALADMSGESLEECVQSLGLPKGGQADLCSTLAFTAARKKKENPAKIAAAWAAGAGWPALVLRAEAVGPYINFYFSKKFWEEVALSCIKGNGAKKGNLRVIVEFPSVNPNKPWHVGHLRNAILGDSLARVLEACGQNVQRMDYIDDLGLQVAQSYWGKLHLEPVEAPAGCEKYAKKADHACGWQYVQVAKRFAEDEEVAGQVRAILREMEDGSNKTAREAREFAQEVVRAQYETAFSLGIYHDALVFESDVVREVFEEGIEKIKKSGALVKQKGGKNDGCWVIPLEGTAEFEGLENADKILIRSDGTATYTGKDVAFHLWKFGLLAGGFEYCAFVEQPNGKTALKTCEKGKKADFGKADVIVNVIGVEQSYPQKVIAATLEKLGYGEEAKNYVHLAYEHVVLPEGKFSGRAGTWMKKEGEGTGFSADELIDEVEKRAYERITGDYSQDGKKKISHAVGIAALRFSFLRSSSNMKIIFDADRALSLSGDSGPYLQYAYARAANILKKSKSAKTGSLKAARGNGTSNMHA